MNNMLSQIIDLLQKNTVAGKIEAIKLLRSIVQGEWVPGTDEQDGHYTGYNMGIKEAKEFIDLLELGLKTQTLEKSEVQRRIDRAEAFVEALRKFL